jgi:hypothetical protein
MVALFAIFVFVYCFQLWPVDPGLKSVIAILGGVLVILLVFGPVVAPTHSPNLLTWPR